MSHKLIVIIYLQNREEESYETNRMESTDVSGFPTYFGE